MASERARNAAIEKASRVAKSDPFVRRQETPDPLATLTRALYNGSIPPARFAPWRGIGGGGLRFLRWHELHPEHQDEAIADLRRVLDNLDLRLERK